MERKHTTQQRRAGQETICWELVGSQVWSICLMCVITFNSQQFSETGFIILTLQRRKLSYGEVKPISQGSSVSKRVE